MKRKFTTGAQAARAQARYGWQNASDETLDKSMNAPQTWRRVDSENLGRIASALEMLVRRLTRR